MDPMVEFGMVDNFSEDEVETVNPALFALAEEVKRELEVRMNFRLSLVVFNIERGVFDLFFLPSSSQSQIDYALELAAQIQTERQTEIDNILLEEAS